MAFEQPLLSMSAQANQDLSDAAVFQFTGVDVAAATGTGLSGTACIPPVAAGGKIVGVLQNNPGLGQQATIVVLGITKMQAGGTIPIGAPVTVNGTGQAIEATTGSYACGTAIEAGATGKLTSILLLPLGKQ